jgi:hypothetical protein
VPQNLNQIASGSITAPFSASTVNDSPDGDGIKLESFDNGDDEELLGTVFASVQNSEVTGNDSDDIQLEAESGELVLRNTSCWLSHYLTADFSSYLTAPGVVFFRLHHR